MNIENSLFNLNPIKSTGIKSRSVFNMEINSLIFIQMNEINFDIVNKYRNYENLPNFDKLFSDFQAIDTFSENEYENLEPWIQWVSFNTGLSFKEHGVHKLGDIVHCPESLVQIFEKVERIGYKIGAISPMNARNRLSSPSYFIPDPWTDTTTDGSPFSNRFAEMLRQTVNDNSEARVSLASFITLIEAGIRSFSLRRSWQLIRTVALSLRNTWYRPMVLDTLIHMIHMKLLRVHRPDASFVFLNAGAHIQHHYFFNSPHSRNQFENPEWYIPKGADPLRDLLLSYDKILGDYLGLVGRGARMVVATGLTQLPYDRIKFYYRLRRHADFFEKLGIKFARVLPRMTRDFEIIFSTAEDTEKAAKILDDVKIERSSESLFGDVSIRNNSIFATLAYSAEIMPDDIAVSGQTRIDRLGEEVVFVALKNGMHSQNGFSFFSPNCKVDLPNAPVHIAALHGLTVEAIRGCAPAARAAGA